MVKAADSPWKLNDRSNNWLKIKPEYVEVRPFVPDPISSWLVSMRCIRQF